MFVLLINLVKMILRCKEVNILGVVLDEEFVRDTYNGGFLKSVFLQTQQQGFLLPWSNAIS